jgi:putative transposase
VADRLHLLQDSQLGLVLPVHRAGRLLALYPRLEAHADHTCTARARSASACVLATDVQETLEAALAKAQVAHVRVKLKPRLLSDNGPCYLSQELKRYLQEREIAHTRGAPYHPMTQGKIERYHRSMKNVVLLQNYFLPGDLALAIEHFVADYNDRRYHEALDTLRVTPADVYFGRAQQTLTRRAEIKLKTLESRRRLASVGQPAALVVAQSNSLARAGV